MAAPVLGNSNIQPQPNATQLNVPITTAVGNAIIMVFVSAISAGTTNVSSSGGLRFVQRTVLTNASSARLEVWWAVAPLKGTYIVQVNWAAPTNVVVALAEIRGANIISPFDPTAGLPGSQASSGTTPTVNVNLLSADSQALLIGAITAALQSGSLTAGAGFGVAVTQGTNSGAGDVTGGFETKVPAGGTSNVTVNGTIANSTYIWYADAINQVPTLQVQPTGQLYRMLGVGCYAILGGLASAGVWAWTHLRGSFGVT